MKRLLCLMLALLVLCPAALADGRDGSANYLYTPHGNTVAAPPAYTLSRSLTARDLAGVDALDGLADAYVTEDAIFVLCASRLLVLDHQMRLKSCLTSFVNESGEEEALAGCTGVTVVPNGEYFITQAEAGRILHFAADHTLLRVLGRPDIVGFENVKYRPTKMVVDNAGRLYVISKGMYEGILELTADGAFTRFFGVNNITFTPWQLVWRVFATAEQRARQSLWLPSDFTNLCVDQDGFMFATLLSQEDATIKRLNAKGENIIKVPDDKAYPVGDLWVTQSGYGIPTGVSQFIAVDVNRYGAYICLDATRSRVFAYNEDHNLLFAFGGPGDREGYFRSPVDLSFVGDDILVLDALAQSLELFSPTAYGRALMNAVKNQYLYEYETASEYWLEALSYNHNLTLAYSGVGRKLLREGEYEQALTYLKMGDDRNYYDKAYEKVRNQTMREYFVPGVCALAGAVVLIAALRHARRARGKRKEATA